MNTNTRLGIFGVLYVAIFFAAMWTITSGVMDIAAYASAPVILCAEALVLGMIYMTTFHGEAPEHAQPFHGGKFVSFEQQLLNKTQQEHQH